LAGQGGGIVVAVACGALEGTPWLAFGLLTIVVLSAVPAATHLRGRLASQALGPLNA